VETFNPAEMGFDTDHINNTLRFAFNLNIASLDPLCNMAMLDFECKTF
jgi:hypothetical protein